MWIWIAIFILGFALGYSLYKIRDIILQMRDIQEYAVEVEKILESNQNSIKAMEKYIHKSVTPAIQKNTKAIKNNESRTKNNENKIDQVKNNDTQRV